MATKQNRSMGSTIDEGATHAGKRDAGTPPDPTDGSTAVETVIPEEWIRIAAYFLAERRGFDPGHELEDWLIAEEGVRAVCKGSATMTSDADTELFSGATARQNDREQSRGTVAMR